MLNWNTFYQQINTTNTPKKLHEIHTHISEVINKDNYDITHRNNGYIVKTHKPAQQSAYLKARQKKPFRKEEWICKLALNKPFDHIGTIVDYQIPLKASISNAKKGKVDLLSKTDETAYLLEVKVPASTESPLRAIMEIYTYWQQLGGDSTDKNENAIDNFVAKSKAAGAKILKKAIVLFENNARNSIYQKLLKDKTKYKRLMNILGVEIFIADVNNDDIITNITLF